MTDTPWLGDACSLVEAFRSGERTPSEELAACYAAMDASQLNAISHRDDEAARTAAATADTGLPFGGVPIGVKMLEKVEGWPDTEASLIFKDRIGRYDSTMVRRLRAGGAVLAAACTASEFGGLNVSRNKLTGTTVNPWGEGRTAGGSSGGSSAAVAGGLLPIATGGDGGGSIRIPAAFNGLVGMKGSAGRIPRGPKTEIAPMTVVKGCQARSVRDVARWYDVTAGFDSRDPYSLPSHGRWEAELDTHDLRGKRAVIAPSLGNAILRGEVEANVIAAAELLVKDTGLEVVEVPVSMPGLGFEWAMANLAQLANDVEGLWPECKDELTKEMAFGLEMALGVYNLEMAAKVEKNRTLANEAMAAIFDQVDFIICATNPDVAYPAEVMANTRVGDQKVGLENNGALTIPANVVGNPAVSIPIEQVDDLPVGMQIIGRHHEDALLLDLARIVERERPWPLVAPLAPC